MAQCYSYKFSGRFSPSYIGSVMHMNNICKRETCNTKTLTEKLVMLTEKYTDRVGEEQQKTIIFLFFLNGRKKEEKKRVAPPRPPPQKKKKKKKKSKKKKKQQRQQNCYESIKNHCLCHFNLSTVQPPVNLVMFD